MARRKRATLSEKRLGLLRIARGYFDAKRVRREAYTDMGLAGVVIEERWKEARPVAKLLCQEAIAEWFGKMARESSERALRADQPDLPGMVLYREEGSKERKRKSIKAATLGELMSYADILSSNADGAMSELRKVRAMITEARDKGCREDEQVWPYLSDEPALPLGPPPSLAEGGDDPSASRPDDEPGTEDA